MKGFKDSSNKFHPITDSKKGVRKSRDQSAKSQGVKLERKARDHTSYCPVCKYEITRGSEQEVREHIKEHIKMQEHREHTKQGIICDCGVRKAREKKFKPVLDEDGDIDTHDQTNQTKLEELIEEETARREEKLIEDEDAYEELLNSGTDDVTAMGVTIGAGTFLREHDHIAFRTSLLDYADGTRQEIKDELEEEIDEEESLEEGKYVGF